MLFPALVILPGMIAAALAVTHQGRLPSAAQTARRLPIIKNDLPAVNQASDAGLQGEAALQAVNTALGADDAKTYKLNRGQNRRPRGRQQNGRLPEETLKTRLQDAVGETDYDGVILSLVKKYCPTGLLGLALTGLLASFMSGMAGNVTAFNTIWTYDLYQAYIAPNKSDHHYAWMGRVITVVGICLSIVLRLPGQPMVQRHGHHPIGLWLCECAALRHLPARHVLETHHRHRRISRACWAARPPPLFSTRSPPPSGNALGIKGGYLWLWMHKGWPTFPMPQVPQRHGPELLAGHFRLHRLLGADPGHLAGHPRTKTDEELKGLVYSLTPKLKDEGQAWYLRPAVLGIVLLDRLCRAQHHFLLTKGTKTYGSRYSLANRPHVLPHRRCS